MSDLSIRPQSPARRNWELNPNSLVGLETSVRNNQQQLAMEYVSVLIHNLLAEVEQLKLEVATLKGAVPVPGVVVSDHVKGPRVPATAAKGQ